MIFAFLSWVQQPSVSNKGLQCTLLSRRFGNSFKIVSILQWMREWGRVNWHWSNCRFPERRLIPLLIEIIWVQNTSILKPTRLSLSWNANSLYPLFFWAPLSSFWPPTWVHMQVGCVLFHPHRTNESWLAVLGAFSSSSSSSSAVVVVVVQLLAHHYHHQLQSRNGRCVCNVSDH